MRFALPSFIVSVSVVLTAALVLSTASLATAPKVRYKNVKALLDSKCVKCHSTARPAEGVDLSSYKAIMKGAEGKPIVVPGKPAESRLIQYVDGTKSPRMPIKAAPLSAKEIALLKAWVKSGAKK